MGPPARCSAIRYPLCVTNPTPVPSMYSLRLLLLVVIPLMLAGIGGNQAAADVPPAKPVLSSEDQALLELLGPGVVGEPVDLDPVTDITHWYPLKDAQGTYQRTVGERVAEPAVVMLDSVERVPHDALGTTGGAWSLNTTKRDIKYLVLDDSNLVLPTETNMHQGVVTTFDPPEPILLGGVSVGQPQTVKSKVAVYDLHDPKDEKYTGDLTFTYEDKGGWRVTVPAGTYDARLIVIRSTGSVGPANIDSAYCVFYAKGIGRIAYVSRRHVSACLVYHKTSQHAMLLDKVTDGDASSEQKPASEKKP